MINKKAYWQNVYHDMAPSEVSWFQKQPKQSLAMILESGLAFDAPMIDVGGGASFLVDHLLAKGFEQLTVVDIAENALIHAKKRLGIKAKHVAWLNADVTQLTLPAASFALWHDRAVFHFLTQEKDRVEYIKRLHFALKPGGHLIIATFAIDGPKKCSGLEIRQYNATTLSTALGSNFMLINSQTELHHTPAGKIQPFIYCHFLKTN